MRNRVADGAARRPYHLKPNRTESDQIKPNPTIEIRRARLEFQVFVILIQWLMAKNGQKPGSGSHSQSNIVKVVLGVA